MSQSPLPGDVNLLVVGGGPAGASLGLAAARLGLSVVIVEKETMPRYRLGETLPPKVLPLLSFLGVDGEVERAGFVRMAGTANLLGESLEALLFEPHGETLGFQAERERLDALLLAAAERSGCVVIQSHEVVGLIQEAGTVRGARVLGPDSQVIEVRAGYVADASGPPAFIARSMGLRRQPATRTVAVTGYWVDVDPPAGFPAEFTLLESLPDGWIWSLLLSDGRRNITIAASAQDHEPVVERYHRMLTGSRVLGPALKRARLEEAPRACDASGAWSLSASGPGFLLVGDASYRVDPLTSQGVYKGMASGILAAAVVNTALRRAQVAEAALAFYALSEARMRRQYAASTYGIYARSPHLDRPFWSERLAALEPVGAVARGLDQARLALDRFRVMLRGDAPEVIRVALHDGVSVRSEPRLDGGFVVWRETLVSADPLTPVRHHPIDVGALARVLDGRTLREIFDLYAQATGTERTPESGHLVTQAVSSLIQDGLVRIIDPK